jgi:proteasome lid subunit RPN8/RPN11
MIIERCVNVPNVHPSPRRGYLMDLAALLAQLRASQAEGWMLRAFFHSHPDGAPTPSATDIDLAAVGSTCIWPNVDQIVISTRCQRLHQIARYEVTGTTWRVAPMRWPDLTRAPDD